MDIKPIRTRVDYRAALKAVESLMGSKARTPEGDRLDVLVTLIEGYECQLHAGLGIPAESLLRQSAAAPAAR